MSELLRLNKIFMEISARSDVLTNAIVTVCTQDEYDSYSLNVLVGFSVLLSQQSSHFHRQFMAQQ